TIDPFSNTTTRYPGTIHLPSLHDPLPISANYTFVAADAGQHTFSATLNTAGSQSLTATDTVTNTITGSQTGITVNTAAASSMVVAGFPSSITESLTRIFTVTPLDAFSNTA